jgi:mRNA interferase RelE/StbE
VSYTVSLSPAAVRQLKKFDPLAKRRIEAVIELLKDNPRPPAARQLVGGGREWRVRTGDYRVIYEINDGELTVLVLGMGHRREVYR